MVFSTYNGPSMTDKAEYLEEVMKMTAKKDYYEVLGVERNADENSIKKAYRKLAKKYHPDTNAGNASAEKKFKEITEAYSVLSDPEKKKLYDQFGHGAFDGSNPGAGAQGGFYESGPFSGSYRGPEGSYQEYHFQGGGNMDDIFGDIFGNMFHGKGGSDFGGQSFKLKGTDLHAEVLVSFDEAAFGCDKIISLQGEDGTVQSLQVHIPAGVDTGKSVRLKGKGNPGVGGGEPGDLFLKMNVGTKPGFERKGMDIFTTAQVPFSTAVFGGEARVKTLHGDVVCKIPEGTQSGTKIRLKGKGIVSMKNAKVYGDQYVTVQIQVPRHLSEDAKQKLREFDKAAEHKGSRQSAA